MPFYDNSDPNIDPKSGDFPTFDVGTYEITGISGFFKSCQDEAGVPHFKLVNEEPRVMVNTAMGSEQGPPYSLNAVQLIGFAHAFGVDVTTLPADRMSAKFLLEWKDAINKSGKKVYAKVTKSDGWIRTVEGSEPGTGVKGLFQVEFRKFYNTDGTVPSFQVDDFGKSKVRAIYEIVALADGSPTLWEGYPIHEPLMNPFDGYRTDDNGKLCMKMRLGKTNNGRIKDVSRAYAFFKYFCDEQQLNMHEWSESDIQNPVSVITKYLVPGRRVRIVLGRTEGDVKRLKIDLLDAEVVESSVPEKSAVSAPKPVVVAEPVSDDPRKHLRMLTEYLNDQSKIVAFGTDFALTPEGQVWMRDNIIEDWSKADMPAHHKFSSLTEEEAKNFLAYLRSKNDIPF